MIDDPLAEQAGLSPYGALKPAGVTPDSSLKDVMDASFELMARNLMTPEVRAAWDQLRLKPRRLLVDLFLYQFDPAADLRRAREALARQFAELMTEPDVSHLLTIDDEALGRMEEDFREIPTEHVELSFVPEFESAFVPPDSDFIRFDL